MILKVFFPHYKIQITNKQLSLFRKCAAKAFYYCPAIISHRPRSQNILKEQALNPEKDSRIKRPRSQVSLEKHHKTISRWKNEPNQSSPLTSLPTQATALASVFGGFATW